VDQLKIIAYYRVSTDKQGRTKLGLEAQRAAVGEYAHRFRGAIEDWYEEVESGKVDARPQLERALSHAESIGARVVVAKLDRLTRDAHFLLSLAKHRSSAELGFCDLPDIPPGAMGRFILTMVVAAAELERGLISERTKAALRAFVENKHVPKRLREQYPDGVPADLAEAYAGKLGSNRPGARRFAGGANPRAAARAGEVSRSKADRAYRHLAERVAAWRGEGKSLRQIAEMLNGEGKTTRRGQPWNHVQVMRVLGRNGVESNGDGAG
jgi:DNA invertase Pin-like site-specific DNA recombinase